MLRCRINGAFRGLPERRIYAAGGTLTKKPVLHPPTVPHCKVKLSCLSCQSEVVGEKRLCRARGAWVGAALSDRGSVAGRRSRSRTRGACQLPRPDSNRIESQGPRPQCARQGGRLFAWEAACGTQPRG